MNIIYLLYIMSIRNNIMQKANYQVLKIVFLLNIILISISIA